MNLFDAISFDDKLKLVSFFKDMMQYTYSTSFTSESVALI